MNLSNNNNDDVTSSINTQHNTHIQGPNYINHNHDDAIVT